jgi:large subunit ribosomal protein L9
MKVILKKDVQALGESGDIVNVADGYARNYLLPSNLAEIATEGALKNREQNLARIKAKAEKLHQEALETAEKIKAVGQVEVTAKAGENGKLFGAITTRRLAELVQEKSGIEVDRRNISLNNPINHLGEYKMNIKLTS